MVPGAYTKTFRGFARAFREADRCRHGFARHRIRHAERAGLCNGGMALEQAVEFRGLHFEPGAIDLIFDAAGDANIAAIVDRAAIAGVKPAVAHDLGREIRAAEITGHQ